MTPARRSFLVLGSGIIVESMVPPRLAVAGGIVEIEMTGRADGSKVWFDPVGVLVALGTKIRWTNRDPGNAHTATAYHPRIDGRQRRIPQAATPWDSGYLLPGESYAVTLTVAGVYDYYCQPHEHAGMVGRILVGDPAGFAPAAPDGNEPPPEIALAIVPTLAEIALHDTVWVE